MTLIVLAAICLLACAFLLFVLFQWTRDTKRKTTLTLRWTTQLAAVAKKLNFKPPPEHPQRSAMLFRKVTPGPEQERAVAFAGLDATGANGLLTRKSSGR